MKSVKEKYRQFLNTEPGARVYNEFKRILYTDKDSLVQTLDNDILQGFDIVQKDILDVCDIGGGDGKRIIHILKYLHSKFQIHFQLDFIEQSKIYIDAFDTTSINNFCKTFIFHKLFEKVEVLRRYDLVFLIHSIFAFENGKALDKVLSLAKRNGKIVVMSNSPDSFLGGLKSLVDDDYDDKRYEIDDLQKELNRRGIEYTYFTFETRWATEKRSFDNDLRTILEWISLGSYQSFSAKKKQLIFDHIDKNTIKADERTLFSEKEAVMIIPAI